MIVKLAISKQHFNFQDDSGKWHDWRVADLHEHAASIPVSGKIDVSRLTIREGLSSRRIDAADLKYPILLSDSHIVDGQHRIAKARKLGIDMLEYKVIDPYDVKESGRSLK